MKRNFLSLVLVMTMLFSVVQIYVFADDISAAEQSENIKIELSAKTYRYGDLSYYINDDNTITIDGYIITYGQEEENIDIPKEIDGVSVTSIGDWAFADCRSTNISIPNSVTSIGDCAFYDCCNLERITIPDGVTVIEGGTFYKCSSLANISIPDSVTTIESSAFYECSSLADISVPDSVTSIESGAFDGTAYYNNEVNWIESVLYIGNHLIDVRSQDIGSEYTVRDGTITIANIAFYNCYRLKSVSIPSSVTSIGDEAFGSCDSLMSINVEENNPNYSSDDGVLFNKNKSELICCPGGKSGSYEIPKGVTSIGMNAFYSCSSLTSVTIPNSVTSIGDDAFELCYGLTSIIIPNSVTSIGDDAFYSCDSLTSIIIPNSVTSIGDDAFGSCDSLTSINVEENNPNYSSDDGVLYNKNKSELICCPGGKSGSYEIPKGVTSIGMNAFYSCGNLTSVTIPDSVTSIGDDAFAYSAGLKSVTIPDSVTSIGGWAFFDCDSLTSITIPDRVISFGERAFAGTAYYNNEENWNENVLYIGNHLIEADSEKIASEYTVITGTITIANFAFEDCTNLTNVYIPDSVTSIGMNAFYSCGSLTSVTIPDSVTSIGRSAFHSCGKLTSIIVPDSVTSIGSTAFYNCRSLISVTIPNSVTDIGDSAFGYCISLASVDIGNSVASIGNSTFSNCFNLASISIGNSVIRIGAYAFSGCMSLTSITIPDSVKYIENNAFSGCSSLTRVIMPDSITSIDSYAFTYCPKLTDVYYSGTKTEWQKINIDTYQNDYLLNANIHYNYVKANTQSEINKNESSEEIIIKTHLDNMDETKKQNSRVYVALYDENDAVIDIYIAEYDGNDITSVLKKDINAEYIRVFVWNKDGSMKPLTDVPEYISI